MKTFYALLPCAHCLKKTIHAFTVRTITDIYIFGTLACLTCEAQTRIRQPLDEADDLLDAILEFYRHMDGIADPEDIFD